MRRRISILSLLCAIAIFSQPLAAMTTPCCGGSSNTYGQIFGGLAHLDQEDIVLTRLSNGTVTNRSPDYSLGGWGGIAFGVFLGPNLATELEVSYRGYHIDDITNTAGNPSGNTSMVALFANVYYRYPCLGCTTPYAGMGVGGVSWSTDWSDPLFVNDSQFDNDQWAFQGIVGVAYALCEDFELFTEYRYVTMSDPEDANAIFEATTEVDNHQIGVGIRMTLRH